MWSLDERHYISAKYYYLRAFNMILLLTREICRLEDEGLCRQIHTQINKHTYTHTLAAKDLTYIMKQFCLNICHIPWHRICLQHIENAEVKLLVIEGNSVFKQQKHLHILQRSTVMFLAWIWHHQCGRARSKLHRARWTNTSKTFQYHIITHLTSHKQLLWRGFKFIRFFLILYHLYHFTQKASYSPHYKPEERRKMFRYS